MDRAYHQNINSLEAKTVTLHLRATIGASGAVTLDAANSKGISTIAKSATGRYTVTLSDAYVSLLGAPDLAIETTSTTIADAVLPILRSVSTTSKSIVISTRRADTIAEADPANGAVLRASFTLKATSV